MKVATIHGLKDTIRITAGGSTLILQRRYLELLDWIRKLGSFSKACKEMGITYKTASSWITTLESEHKQKIVLREKGGLGGGGTRVSEQGTKLIEQYYAVMSPTRSGFTRSFLEMHMSARNILEGTVLATRTEGQVSKAEVQLDAPQKISAIITTESLNQLGLRPGEKVLVIIKATEPMIMKGTSTKS